MLNILLTSLYKLFLACRAHTLVSSTPTPSPLLCWWAIRLLAIWTVYFGPPSQQEDWLSSTCPTNTQHPSCSSSVWYECTSKRQIQLKVKTGNYSPVRKKINRQTSNMTQTIKINILKHFSFLGMRIRQKNCIPEILFSKYSKYIVKWQELKTKLNCVDIFSNMLLRSNPKCSY